jgi:hypothetical protein
MLTQMCVEGQCDGDATHEQRWDNEDPGADHIVYRQSFPHAGEAPNLPALVARLLKLRYRVRAAVVVRDWRSTVLSQINAGHAGSIEEAEWKIRQALFDLMQGLRRAALTDYRLVTYESLASVEIRLELARFLEVPDPERFARFPFKNENLKHYAPELKWENDMEDWEEFIEEGESLLTRLDDLPDRAADFADSVREKVEGMVGWAREHEQATDRMWGALENMSDGVRRWER